MSRGGGSGAAIGARAEPIPDAGRRAPTRGTAGGRPLREGPSGGLTPNPRREPVPRPVVQLARRVGRGAEEALGDLGEGEPLEVAQEHRLALVGGEAVERGLEAVQLL